MRSFVDGIVVLLCAFTTTFFASQGKYLIALLALIIGVLAYNSLARRHNL